jgi:hypothetical protein
LPGARASGETAGALEGLPSAPPEVDVPVVPLVAPPRSLQLGPGEATNVDRLSTMGKATAPTELPGEADPEGLFEPPGKVDLTGALGTPLPESQRAPTPLPVAVDAMALLATAQGNLTSEVGEQALVDLATALDNGGLKLDSLPDAVADGLHALRKNTGPVVLMAERLVKAITEDGATSGFTTIVRGA